MKIEKIVLILLVVFIMMMFPAMASEGDVQEKATGKQIVLMDYLLDEEIFLGIVSSPGDYEIEISGNYYPLDKILTQFLDKNAQTLGEALNLYLAENGGDNDLKVISIE